MTADRELGGQAIGERKSFRKIMVNIGKERKGRGYYPHYPD